VLTFRPLFFIYQNKTNFIMISELKAFLLRGDVLGLAIAVMIAGGFQKIIDSLVADVITPIIGMVGGQPDFSSIMLGPIKIGNFINAVIGFIILGLILFSLVKAAGKKAE
jgi:large conductance mechanosensitive channel